MILLWVLCCALSCGRSDAIDPATQQVTVASSQQNTPTPINTQLAIGHIEFFASWRGSYIKLDQWKDASDPKIPHPEAFDVLCHIENKGDSTIQQGDFIILTTLESVVAPTYLHGGDLKAIMNEVHWLRETAVDDVKMEEVPYIQPKGSAPVKIKGFNLGNLLKQFNGEEDTLWPWALRINVHIMNRDMTRVALGQAILPMIPSDRRLSTK